jgi:hypothetical protein
VLQQVHEQARKAPQIGISLIVEYEMHLAITGSCHFEIGRQKKM